MWHQVGLFLFNYQNDARSNKHKIYICVKHFGKANTKLSHKISVLKIRCCQSHNFQTCFFKPEITVTKYTKVENKNRWTYKEVPTSWSFVVPSSPGSRVFFVDCSIQGIRALGTFETSINDYQSTRCNIKGDMNHQQQH